MVISCSAFNCTNRWNKENDLTFHRFPLKNPELLKKWIIAVKRKGFKPTSCSFLCGNHFRTEDYVFSPGTSRKRLKPEAVPSVFDFPSHLMPPNKQPRRHVVRILNGNSAIGLQCSTMESTPHLHTVERESCVENKAADDYVKNVDADNCVETGGDNCVENETVHNCDNAAVDSHTRNDCGIQSTVIMVDKATETCNFLPEEVHELKRKLKCLQEKLRRREKKVYSMQDVISALKEKGHLTEKLYEFLNQQKGTQVELVCNLVNNCLSSKGNRYTTDVKMFAMTVYFYSPKAYEYLQKIMPLPHKSLISKWVASVNCEPGFLNDVFKYIDLNPVIRDEFKDACLIVDSMAIRKQVVWDQGTKQYTGFVDFGGEIPQSREVVEASEALVFMLVSIKGKFKCPIAYFFINSIDADNQAKLIKSALERLYHSGIKIWCVTCDGCKVNISTLRSLGCTLNFSQGAFKSHFPHPVEKYNVYCMLDMCHLIKLARNALAEVSVIESPSGVIRWNFIERLNKLQTEEGMTFANKLSGQHINYVNRKMNVGLAAQTLSSSVADTIDFLRRVGDVNFIGSEATVEFLYYIDRIFDMLNSRNPLAKGYKSPLRVTNQGYWMGIFKDTENYIRSLKVNGVPLLMHGRNTFAFGIIFNMQSVRHIALASMLRIQSPLKYLLTYKLSQDHLERFFSCIRSRGGWNNNPNAYQFKCAMRKLLLGNCVSPVNGNCLNFNVSYLPPIYDFHSIKHVTENDGADIENEVEAWCSLLDDKVKFSFYKQNILYYIAGYLSLQLSKQITCHDCLHILKPPVVETAAEHDAPYAFCITANKNAFVKFVSRGKLVETSDIVYSVIEYAEKLFQISVIDGDMRQKNLLPKILHCVKKKFVDYPFPALSHDYHNEFGIEDLHQTQLVCKISSMYATIRLKTYGKKISLEKIGKNKSSIRQKFNKLILFNHV